MLKICLETAIFAFSIVLPSILAVFYICDLYKLLSQKNTKSKNVHFQMSIFFSYISS